MNKWLNLIGNVLGVAGMLACLVLGLLRLTGRAQLWGFDSMTLFIAGIALIVAGLFCKLHLVQSRLDQ